MSSPKVCGILEAIRQVRYMLKISKIIHDDREANWQLFGAHYSGGVCV